MKDEKKRKLIFWKVNNIRNRPKHEYGNKHLMEKKNISLGLEVQFNTQIISLV